uniref:F-box domain-containing protein n=1 Tax=Trichuris muris TaxID=70415 RepID=A0A5S6QI85_TRIMR
MDELSSRSPDECVRSSGGEPAERNGLFVIAVGEKAKAKTKRKCVGQPTEQCVKKSCQVICGEDSPQCSLIGAIASEDVPDGADSEGEAPSLAGGKVDHWIDEFQTWTSSEKIRALGRLVKSCSLIQLRELHRTIEPYFQRDFISHLPKEIALYILSFLSPTDLVTASMTCRYWKLLSDSSFLWRRICQQANIALLEPAKAMSEEGTLKGCPWRYTYIRHKTVEANWRRGCPLRELLLRGHDEHVITCLQVWNDKIVSGSDDDTLKIWCSSTGRCLLTLTGHTGGVWSSQVAEDGRRIASGSTDRTVRIWDAETGRCIHALYGHTSTVRCLALKENILISGSRDATLRVWNIDTGECLAVLSGHVAAVRCVQFDGRRAVSGAYDFSVKVWDVSAKRCIHTLIGHNNRVYSLQFDSARDLVISGSLDTSIRVWEIVTGRCLFTLVGHQSLTSGMQLRGNILVSGNADSTIKVWDVTTGECLHTLSGPNRHHSAVTSLQFLPNGLVVSSSDDGCVKLWDAVSGVFIRDLIRLPSGGSGGCIWRLRATMTALICAVGSRNGTEDTKILVIDFDNSSL